MIKLNSYLAHLDKLNVVGGEDYGKSFKVETQAGDIADITYRVDTHTESHHPLTFQAILLVSIDGKNVFRWGAESGEENKTIAQWVYKKMEEVLSINRATERRVHAEFESFIVKA
jgi:hypothetical protein